MTKLAAAVLAGALVTLGAAGCGGDSGGDDGAGGDKGKKVGLAYDIGGRGDKSFNDAAYRGLQKAKKQLGISFKDLEAKDGETDTDKVQRLELLAKSDHDPIIGVGFSYSKAIAKVAKKYPKVHFGIIDDASNKEPNLTNLVFTENESSFLVGAAAALKSKSDTVGFVGGVNTPLIQKFEAGYVAGAKKVNPKIKVKVGYISQPPDNSGFKDPAKGKTMTQGMIDDGADVIYGAAGLSNNGIIAAAAAKKKWAIGVDSDQYKSAPGDEKQYVLTSALKQVDTAVFNFIKQVQDGKAKGGTETFSLKDDGVDYSKSNTDAIEDIQPKLDKLKKQIIDGKIKVPSKP